MGRYFVRFTEETEREMVLGSFVLAGAPESELYAARKDPHLLIADLGPEEVESARESGAEVFEDVLFQVVAENPLLPNGLSENWEYWREPDLSVAAPEDALAPLTQNDVMAHIKAPEAWESTRGAGVTIAIVDTGISGVHSEFPAWKRSPHSLSFSFPDPWSDPKGHGSMCASAAGATDADGGRFNGVAPDATLLAARTTLFSTDIYKIYDTLIDRQEAGDFEGKLVVSNSYGLYRCTAPDTLPEDHPYLDVVREAVTAGITVVFAAGNNHYDVLCNHDPAACGPNTIWGVNSIDEVITVGTVNRENSNRQPGDHANSSRGPGQWGDRSKPDVVAPTYGEIVWGDGYQNMSWWGTSGACPQVAGVAALMLSVNPSLSPAQICNLVRSAATEIEGEETCVGAGLINCEAAVAAAGSAGG